MNKKIVLGIAAVAMSAVFCTGCGTSAGAGRRTVLGEAKAASDLSYSERTEGLYEIIGGAERFAAEFAVKAYDGGSGNFAVSPVSVYMALALAAECTNGDTQKEILSALGVSYETLQSDFSVFYRSVAAEYYSNADRLSACVVPANSIWVSSGVRTNESRIQTLASDYYCSSYAADFANDNAGANAAVRDYVKKQTRGLIDQSFDLNEETLFALINTLYLKEIWNAYGDPLRFTDDAYGFKQADGTVKETKLLSGYYASGKAYESETFTSFFARTEHGYQLKFLLPKEGYSVGEIFTAENLEAVGSENIYDGWDHENMIPYNTRCLFPEYKAECDLDVASVLREL
ncbi:MAG: hypothetical protein K2H43_05075, partial [Clostridia bacterium]|nr:hypothetical protein [Clostridia bacterium]